MKKQNIELFWIGIFVLGVLGTVSWLLLFLHPSFGDGQKELRVRFANIEHINIGTRVTYAGKPVGRVIAINEIFDARDQPPSKDDGDFYFYELVLEVDSKVKIFSYDEIIFTTVGLLGEKSIAIIPRLTPRGEKKATELPEGEIIYARSGETIDDTLRVFSKAAKNLNDTLTHLNSLFECEDQPLCETLKSVDKAANAMGAFFTEASDAQLVEHLTKGVQDLSLIAKKFGNDQSTFGQLLSSDLLHREFIGLMYEVRTTFHDINNYGLFFQFNRRWQQLSKWRRNCCTEMPCER